MYAVTVELHVSRHKSKPHGSTAFSVCTITSLSEIRQDDDTYGQTNEHERYRATSISHIL